MIRSILLPALFVLALGCGGGRAASSTQSTQTVSSSGSPARTRSIRDILGPLRVHQSPAQLDDVASLIRRWEQDPYAPLPENDTQLSNAAVMLMWLTESPDVSVTACMAVSMLSEGQGADVGPPVTMGSMFGMAAYLIEHPGSRPTSPEVQVGGIESGLRWYAASLRGGGGTNALLEDLVARYAQGGFQALLAWYAERGIRCGDG